MKKILASLLAIITLECNAETLSPRRRILNDTDSIVLSQKLEVLTTTSINNINPNLTQYQFHTQDDAIDILCTKRLSNGSFYEHKCIVRIDPSKSINEVSEVINSSIGHGLIVKMKNSSDVDQILQVIGSNKYFATVEEVVIPLFGPFSQPLFSIECDGENQSLSCQAFLF